MEAMAPLWHQEVKWHVIARLPQVDFTLGSQAIVSFIIGTVSRELVPGSREKPDEPGRTAGVTMRSTTQEVDFRYSRDQLGALFRLASAKDDDDSSCPQLRAFSESSAESLFAQSGGRT